MQPPVLIYDGDCGFCTRTVQWGQRHIARMTPAAPYQSSDLAALGLDEARCSVAVQYVTRGGEVRSAQDGVAATLLAAGRGWWVLGALLHVPGLHWLAGVLYRWVARNRHRLMANSACSSSG